MRIVLASGSPRRRELMGLLRVPFEVAPADVCEGSHPYDGNPVGHAMALARAKSAAAAELVESGIVIGADTVVFVGGEIYGKPTDANDARRMLRSLSSRAHCVSSAMCLLRRESWHTVATREDAPVTKVTFRELSDSVIESYVATGEPFDKAGAYGVQGFGSLLVESVEGCYANVVGLSIVRVAECLHALGANVWAI